MFIGAMALNFPRIYAVIGTDLTAQKNEKQLKMF
jgi:hypothetical protein